VKKSKVSNSWTEMLQEEGVRERISKENADAVKLLDYLSTRITPYKEKGWTSFNDWLDLCYRKGFASRKKPEDVPEIRLDMMRGIVFPTSRANF
jgi:hypothetical protein